MYTSYTIGLDMGAVVDSLETVIILIDFSLELCYLFLM